MTKPRTEIIRHSTDLWWEARQKSQAEAGKWWVRLLSWLLQTLVPRRYPGLVARTFGTGQTLWCVDLNKYRPNVNVELLIDQGVRVFMLRVGGPKAWIYGYDMLPVMDPTFTGYYERIRAYAKQKNVVVWIIGYGVHNPWANEERNYQGLDPQVQWLKEATRNHLCDAYCWDDEVAEIWKDGRNTVCTPTNLAKSISICMEQTYQEMERSPLGPAYHKMPLHYSANWYMKKFGATATGNTYTTWLDNANKDINNRHLLTWRAWVPTVFSTAFATIGDLFAQVITPTGLQDNAFLRMGTHLVADFWQCTFTAMGPWCPDENKDGKPDWGIDASTGYGACLTAEQFAFCANLPIAPVVVTPPPVPGMLTGAVNGDVVTLSWIASEGAAKYTVYRNTVQVGVVTVPGWTEQVPTSGTYVYAVTASRDSGETSEPALTQVTVGGPPPSGEYLTVKDFNTWLAGDFKAHTHGGVD